MFLSLLEGEATTPQNNANWVMYVIIGVFLVAMIVMMVISSRRRKKEQQESENLINAVKPGNKVKTVGGICGIVVEVNDEENTFVLETGSEGTGKNYLKFVKQAILETDAVVEKKDAKADDRKEEQEELPASLPEEDKTEDAEPEETKDKE